MGIKPLDSGLWSGEWRLDVGRATTGETDFVVALGDICSEKNSGAQAWICAAQTLYFSAHTEKKLEGTFPVLYNWHWHTLWLLLCFWFRHQLSALLISHVPLTRGPAFRMLSHFQISYKLTHCPCHRNRRAGSALLGEKNSKLAMTNRNAGYCRRWIWLIFVGIAHVNISCLLNCHFGHWCIPQLLQQGLWPAIITNSLSWIAIPWMILRVAITVHWKWNDNSSLV